MIKEEKNIDFYTTGRQPSEKEFAKISEWIKKDQAKKILRRTRTAGKESNSRKKNITTSGADQTQHQKK